MTLPAIYPSQSSMIKFSIASPFPMTFGCSVVHFPLTYSRQRPARSTSIFLNRHVGQGTTSRAHCACARSLTPRAGPGMRLARYMHGEHARNKKARISWAGETKISRFFTLLFLLLSLAIIHKGPRRESKCPSRNSGSYSLNISIGTTS